LLRHAFMTGISRMDFAFGIGSTITVSRSIRSKRY
jgi:hypothetical protein